MRAAASRCYVPGMHRVLHIIGLVGLLSGVGCEDPPPATCMDHETSFERDRCLHDEITVLPADQSALVLEKAKAISDPMIRGSAVSTWVSANVSSVPRETGEALCALLDGRDRSYCQRRLTSPHLQR